MTFVQTAFKNILNLEDEDEIESTHSIILHMSENGRVGFNLYTK